jgi:hypothetical protein
LDALLHKARKFLNGLLVGEVEVVDTDFSGVTLQLVDQVSVLCLVTGAHDHPALKGSQPADRRLADSGVAAREHRRL